MQWPKRSIGLGGGFDRPQNDPNIIALTLFIQMNIQLYPHEIKMAKRLPEKGDPPP